MSTQNEPTQFRIPPATKLIIVDAHDTIFKPDLSRTESDIFYDPMKKERITWMLRYGFLNFIEYFAGRKKIDIVVSSDGNKKRLTQIAQQFGIFNKLKGIYGAEHIDKWDYLKRIDRILDQCHVEPRDAVFIGDSKVDEYSAEKHGVPFIQVPNTVSNRAFSFNSFLEIDFQSGDYGLELIDLHRIRQVSHNLSTPQLVEEVIRRQEGILAHLGPVVISSEDFQSANDIGVYLVKEPSSESEINWGDDILPFDVDSYHDVFARLKDYLNDQSVYIQDCYAGSEATCRIPLRIITHDAWPNLFARHMFRQATDEEMESFFPEYTLIHVPSFRIHLNAEKSTSESFILINLLKKLILVVGAHSSNVIRKAVFLTLSFILPKNDMIPVRCSANKGDDGSLSLFIGQGRALRNSLCLNTDHAYFGDDCHGWTQENFINIEWGCRTPVDGVDQHSDPEVYSATRKFSTILENIVISERRRLKFERKNPKYHAIASFPIAHLSHADRSGVASFPKNLFIIVKDSMGVLPSLGKITREQASIFLLLGYWSEWAIPEQDEFPAIHFHPFYNSDPSIYSETFYTALFYEKLERSQTQCWIVNAKPLGPNRNEVAVNDQQLLSRFVSVVQSGDTQQFNWCEDKCWKYQTVRAFDAYPEILLNPEKAWESDQDRYQQSILMMKRAFSKRLAGYHDDLALSLKNVGEWFAD